MNKSHIEQLVLQYVDRPNYTPVKARILARNLDIPKDQQDSFKRFIKQLVREGKLAYAESHKIQSGGAVSADAKGNEVIGKFQRKAGGFGFVRPENASTSSRDNDIYIPAPRTMDATSGDRVRVRVRMSRRGKALKLSGEILEVIERGTKQFVGTYFEEYGRAFVRVSGDTFEAPISVGDPGAKNAQPNDKVVIEMVRYPTNYREGEAVITDVLGPRGMPGVDTLSIIYEFGLPQDFPEAALDDARDQADAFDESISNGRVDLTQATIITIDPKDARDFDDAISLERLENGHWRLGVHIADVSHFVRPGTALDDEAKQRGTSVYLPDRVIPMLPEVISNNLASLQPDRVRYTKSAFIEYTDEGTLVDTEFCTGAIKSQRRFTYEEVDDYLAHPVQWKDKLSPEVFSLLDRMHKLSRLLRKRRMTRGSLELTLPEVKIDLDKHGRVAGAHRVEHTESHQMIEEFMLAANEAVAVKLTDLEIHFLRRIHESPEPRKMKVLTEFVRELGIEADSLESRFEVKRVLELVHGRPEEQAINFAVLRSLPKATYGPQVEGHYALASDNYCHFTSPIRRYPDLTIHRMLESIFRGQRPADDFDLLANLGDHCSEQEQRAERAERELIKLKLLSYMEKRIGESLEAVVSGVEEFGVFAQGIEIPAEGLLPLYRLPEDRYDYDQRAHALMGRRGNTFRLGDRLVVEIAAVDMDQRKLEYGFVSFGSGKRKQSKPGSRAGQKRSSSKQNSPRRRKR